MIPERDPRRSCTSCSAGQSVALARGADAGDQRIISCLGLLEHAGWGPDFTRCAHLLGSVAARGRDRSSMPRGGGVICARHEVQRIGGKADDPRYRPSRRIIDPELARARAGVRASSRAPDSAPPPRCRAATALLDRLIELHVPRTARARRVLAELRSTNRAARLFERPPSLR